MIGRDTNMSRPRFDHLQHGLQHADHGAEGRILTLMEAAKAVKVAEQLVCAVDKMDDHAQEHAADFIPCRFRGPSFDV
jgi:hypothetical protein